MACCHAAEKGNGYMTRINKVYANAYNKTPAAIVADNELSEQIRKELVDKMKKPDSLTEEAIADLIYAGSSYGQAQGFESGFKYAMALIFESLAC